MTQGRTVFACFFHVNIVQHFNLGLKGCQSGVDTARDNIKKGYCATGRVSMGKNITITKGLGNVEQGMETKGCDGLCSQICSRDLFRSWVTYFVPKALGTAMGHSSR